VLVEITLCPPLDRSIKSLFGWLVADGWCWFVGWWLISQANRLQEYMSKEDGVACVLENRRSFIVRA
jgi:hypothetical protein